MPTTNTNTNTNTPTRVQIIHQVDDACVACGRPVHKGGPTPLCRSCTEGPPPAIDEIPEGGES